MNKKGFDWTWYYIVGLVGLVILTAILIAAIRGESTSLNALWDGLFGSGRYS